MRYGWLDATVFIHALFEKDPHMPRCRRILRGLEETNAEGWLDPVTIHELTYALPRALPTQFGTREDVVRYLSGIENTYGSVRANQRHLLHGHHQVDRIAVQAIPSGHSGRLRATMDYRADALVARRQELKSQGR